MSARASKRAVARAVSVASGALFGFGLALAGMTRTENVRGFLDFAGAWNPALLFVMGGAVAVHAVAYRLIARRGAPVLADGFSLPTQRRVDARLIAGAALFGVGWGLGGFCPGPGLVSVVAGAPAAVTFVLAMLAGLAAADALFPRERPAEPRQTEVPPG